MAVYADTNFLGSYYLPDANSALAIAAARLLSVPIMFSAFHRLELRNALALDVFGGRITAQYLQRDRQYVNTDLPARILAATRVNWYAALRAASLLSAQL